MILAYTRVSTEEQAKDDRTSLGEQERVIRGLASMRGAKAFDVALFSDPGVSGATPLSERPAGKAMLAAAKKGDMVVATKMDRLFRSASDALNTAEQLKERGIDLILIDIGTDPVTGNGVAKLFFTILSGVAEFERDRIAERITQGKKSKLANGGHAGGSPPFGFRQVGRGRKARLEPVLDEQAVLNVVYELKDKRPIEICRVLGERKLTSRAGSAFQVVQIQRMLARVDNET